MGSRSMGRKSDTVYMEKALTEIDLIRQFTDGLTYEQYISDIEVVYATMFALQQLVEHIKSLSFDFKEHHSEIPWNEIVGFRNRIVHEYGKTDYTTVYDTITNDIYQLKELFENSI